MQACKLVEIAKQSAKKKTALRQDSGLRSAWCAPCTMRGRTTPNLSSYGRKDASRVVGSSMVRFSIFIPIFSAIGSSIPVIGAKMCASKQGYVWVVGVGMRSGFDPGIGTIASPSIATPGVTRSHFNFLMEITPNRSKRLKCEWCQRPWLESGRCATLNTLAAGHAVTSSG